MNDSATTVLQAQIAELAGTSRAAVTQWRKKHADFPAPVAGAGNKFKLDEVIAWLDGKAIPADGRKPGEATGATYGDRVRRRLHSADHPIAAPLVRSVLALEPQVCGDAPRSNYLYVLHCMAHLRLYNPERWAQLLRAVPRSGIPGDAQRLLRAVVAAVDGSLSYPELLSHPDSPPARLRPLAFEPVRKVIELVAAMQPGDLRQLSSVFIRGIRAQGDAAFWTPTSITQTMVGLLADDIARDSIRVYDPYARFGELAAEFCRGHADPAALKVSLEHPYPANLRLAGMSVAAIGAHADLATTSSPLTGGANFLLTNPPFNGRTDTEWLRRSVAALAEDGRAAVLMPYGAGFDHAARAHEARRELVEHGAVLAVIALPAQMFPGTSVGVCIWLLRKPTGYPAPILLVDASKLGRKSGTPLHNVLDQADIEAILETVSKSECRPTFSALVVPDEIRAHGYSLHPPEYQDRTLAPTAPDAARADLDALFEGIPSPAYTTGTDAGWPRRPLREVCDILTGVPNSTLKKALAKAGTARDAVPVVHPKHLRDGLICRDDAPDADAAALGVYRLQPGDVLLIRTGAMGKTAIVRDGEFGWVPHTNLIRLRVTAPDELSPAYLLACLSQASVQDRIQDRSVRSLTTSLRADTLRDFEIPLPPLANQQHILSALRSLDEQTAEIEQRLNASRAARAALARHLTEGTVVLTEGGSK